MAREASDVSPLTLDPTAARLLAPGAGVLEPPIRSVIFGGARFSEHGKSLALAHEVADARGGGETFFPRLQENLQVLQDSRTLLEEHAAQGHHLSPAAVWLIDNGMLIERQLDTVRSGLSRRYFEKLPRLRDEPLAGLPRIYGLAWAWVAHTDSGLDEDLLELFLSAYQSQRELTLAELWAIPNTLRVVLLENLRRLAERAAATQAAFDTAHRYIDQAPAHAEPGLLARVGAMLLQRGVLEAFALQLQRRSDDWPAAAAPELRGWLSAHLPDPAGALQRQQQQAAEDHHSVRSAVTSLRGLDEVDWRGMFMRSSAVMAQLQRLPVFAAEADSTQDLTLHDIEKLARRARMPESRVSAALLRLSGRARSGASSAPLHWLRGEGRGELLLDLGLSRSGWIDNALPACRRHATAAYLTTLAVASAALVAAVLSRGADPSLPGWALVLTAFLLLWPATEAVVAIVHRLISESVPPRRMPRLALPDGIPILQRPLVVMPVMLTSLDAVQALADQLEQHHLANPERHAQFALLSDDADAATQHTPEDAALLGAAREAIEGLNRRYAAAPGTPLRFLLLHRERRWAPSEKRWIGWERKRGKLEQLVSWLAGASENPFVPMAALSTPAPAIRSSVTLDSDTDMPPGRLRELVAIAAHPLNVPVIDAAKRRVVAGYGILQPRVVVPLPTPGTVTLFHWLFSGHWGVDAYSAASSEIYEDVFGEGSFSGKGLLDVAAFHATLSQRLPEAQVLSHDLLEGAFARCAAVSDVTLVEDVPGHPDVASSRLHRWTRGDWQLLPFIVRPRAWPMAGINRWKMFDNLRRSLVAPMSLALFVWVIASNALPLSSVFWLVLAAYGAGPVIGALAALAPQRDGVALGLFFGRSVADLMRALMGTLWHLCQLLAQALLSVDAVFRTLVRLFITRRHLLQWKTAAAAQAAARTDLPSLLRRHRRVPLVAAVMFALLALAWQTGRPLALGWAAVLCAVWAAAPFWTWLASHRLPARAERLDDRGREFIRELAVDTWRYYERYVGDHHLPPDNVQMTEAEPMVAHRTSPTNIGLYLLAAAAARELGIIGIQAMTERIEGTLATLDRMPRWHGHFYNWYDTQTLAVLAPNYVSSVDSGNFSGHLLVVSAACDLLSTQPRWDTPQRSALAISARRLQPLATTVVGLPALAKLAQQSDPGGSADFKPLQALLENARRELDGLQQGQSAADSPPAMHRFDDHIRLLEAWLQDQQSDAALLRERLRRLATHCRTLALAADFRILYDPRRRLLHIGYAVDTDKPDASHYDLLASEARLASLVGIAKGDLPPRHWSALGRPLFAGIGPGCGGVGLKSWSGSMFEYLMPTLVLDEPAGSVLYEATRSAVAAQRNDARDLDTPWGVSESAIAVQDHTLAYQYGPQGVASLALRRTPSDERVIAPYAAAMALMVAPQAAADNLHALQALGARRSLGFIEALDYTPRRQPAGGESAFTAVETFMAHHQAMSFLACAHVLTGGAVQRWSARQPHLRAVLPLLHERAPHQVAPLREQPPPPLQTPAQRQRWQYDSAPLRTAMAPMHLLGNDRYAVALRANGAGFSQWQGNAITRWRDDALRDGHGVFGYVRRPSASAESQRWDSLAARPAHPDSIDARADTRAEYRAEFHPDRVLLHARWPDLFATTTVSVSTRDDCELRHIHLHNPGRKPLRLTLAMAFEAVLAPQRADEAHPAFSNLFIEARWSATERALFLQRKPRLADESAVHAVHFLAACDDPHAEVAACADRASWIGRLGSAADPAGEGPTSAPASQAGRAELQLDTGLDPMSVITVQMALPPGASRSLTFVIGAAADEDTLRALVDRYQQPAAATDARDLSDTLARIRLRELRLGLDTWVAWLHLNTLLASALTRSLAPPGESIDRRALYRHGIGGERPIFAMWVEGPDGLDVARQVVSMLTLWTSAGQPLDLVIINAEPPSYQSPVQQAFVGLAELAALRVDPQLAPDRRASLKLLNARDLQGTEQATLRLIARVALQADGRSLAQHVERLRAGHDEDAVQRRRQPRRSIALPRPDVAATPPPGRFEGRDAAFRFTVSATRYPARPWVNVLANPEFGCQVSEAAAGFSWAGNSRLHQITAWSNDALTDPASEAVLLEDIDSQRVWWLGRGLDGGGRSITHSLGSTRIQQVIDGLSIDLWWCVDADAAVKQLLVSVSLLHGPPRRLRLVGYAEWTMGGSRNDRATVVTRTSRWSWPPPRPVAASPASEAAQSTAFMVEATQLDAAGGRAGATAFLGWRPCSDRPGAAVVTIDADDWTCDRREFFDGHGRWVMPSKLRSRAGVGLDPCGAVGCHFEVAPGRPAQTALLLGHADSSEAARKLAQQAWLQAPAERLARQVAMWPELLGSVEVHTPDALFDAMVNRWLPYQAIACRLWARAGFYQAGGAFGFRDQLQDAMNLADRAPQLLQRQIVVNAARQFVEGDVQHWWHPPSGAGVRTRMTDDLLWLPYAVAHSLSRGGPPAMLDEVVPFLRSPPVPEGREDLYAVPEQADEAASVYEHAARAIDRGLTAGAHGLPLMGTGDWNDGMNRVGHEGRGESVWLGWFLCAVIDDFSPLAEQRGDLVRVARWRSARSALAAALDSDGWDGDWYRRAFFDDGTPLGSASRSECRIDLIAQAWAVLSGAGDPARAALAMASADALLWDGDARVMKLLDPPLSDDVPNAGYIQAYPKGIRENGGQYNHAAVWALMAQARLGQADKAWRTFQAASPAHRAADPATRATYQLEPYVAAGDIYSQPPYAGRGGWSWYTGSASWLQRAGIESICGLVLNGRYATLQPCLPPHWPQVELTIRREGRTYRVTLCREPARVDEHLAQDPDCRRADIGERLDLDALVDGCRLVMLLPASAVAATGPGAGPTAPPAAADRLNDSSEQAESAA